MSRARKQSRDKQDGSEIFSDLDFDADDFVEHMDDAGSEEVVFRAGWRQLEALHEERMLRKELSDFEDWDDFDA